METEDRTVIILRGIPGAGKTTYAKKLVADGWNRVNKDDIRHMINGYKMNNADEPIIQMIQDMAIIGLMNEGRNIVIDNTHAKQKYIDDLMHTIKIFNQEGDLKMYPTPKWKYNVVIKTLDTPLEECIERNAKRERPVPEAVLRTMHKNLFG